MDTPLSLSRLEALLESAQLLHSTLEVDDLLKHLLRTIMGRLAVGRGLIALEDGGTLRVSLVRGFKGISAGDPFGDDAARTAGARLIIPIGDEARPLGVVAVGARLAGEVEPEEREFVRALAGVAASGIENARAHQQVRRLNRRLDQTIHELKTMLELVRALTKADSPDEVAQLLGLTLAGQWAVGRYAVIAAKAGHPLVLRQKGATLTWQADWHGALSRAGDAGLVENLPAGSLRDTLVSQKLVVLFPLRSATETLGYAALGSRPGGRPYGDADLEFGAGLAAQAVVALENGWHVRELLEKKQIERELALAASIQQGLFPSELPTLSGCEIAAANRPAQQVGGDYYDALAIDAASPTSRCLFCVADVSGKGIGASLLMSTIQATLRALLGRQASLPELARATNELLYTTTPGNKYVTAILLAVDPLTGSCRYVNGGHCPGLVIRASGEVERLPATGLALGLFPGQSYHEGEFVIAPGDLVALYSDGVSEALDPDDEEYGVDRLIATLAAARTLGAAELVHAVLADLGQFARGAGQNDDITLLVLRRVGT